MSENEVPIPAGAYERPPYSGQDLVITAYAVTNTFLVITTFLYFHRRHHEYLRARLTPIVIITALCNIILNNQFMSEFPVFRIIMPCPMLLVVYYFVAPLWVFTFFLRAGHLLLTFVSTQARLELSITGHITIYDRMNLFEKMMLRVHIFFFGSTPGQWASGTNTNIKAMHLLRTYLSFFILQVAVFVIVLIVKGGDVSTCTDSDYAVLFGFVGVFLLTIPYLLYTIRGVHHDAFHIRREMIITLAMFWPVFTIFLLSLFVFTELKPKSIESNIYMLGLLWAAHIVNVVYPTLLSFISDFRRRNLSQSKESFEKMMEDPVLWPEFKKQLAQEFVVENGMFVDEYRSFKRNRAKVAGTKPRLGDNSLAVLADVKGGSTVSATNQEQKEESYASMQRQQSTTPLGTDQTAALFDRFVKVGALYELNLPAQVRADCERKMSTLRSSTNSVPSTCIESNLDAFDGVYQEVLAMMYQNSFPRFVKHQKMASSKIGD
ncbi:hypothetical protein HK102_010261 [Quaeritorhiza haematococci]|nr:hypothetical protein HK102_010261 [Quaeritorhiza haematococci]